MKITDKITDLTNDVKLALGIETAEQQLERSFAVEREVDVKIQLAERELGEARSAAGESLFRGMLAGDDGTDTLTAAAAKESGLVGRIATLRRASEVARDGRPARILQVYAERVGKLQADAAVLRTKADDLDAECRPFLDKLRELQGCRYEPFFSRLDPTYSCSLDGKPIPPEQFERILPRSKTWRGQAAELERQANELRQRQVVSSGSKDADSIEALVQQACGDPFVIGPLPWKLREWASAAYLQAVPKRRPTMNGMLLKISYVWKIVWRDGELIEDECQCRCVTHEEYDLPEGEPVAA